MSPAGRRSGTWSSPSGQTRRELALRLVERRAEIETTALIQVDSLSGSTRIADVEYTDGLQRAVSAAIDFGLTTIDCSEAFPPPIPAVLLAQARLAARNRVDLGIVLRRYMAGFTLLGRFLFEEISGGGPLGAAESKSLIDAQSMHFDRLLVAVTEEYDQERRRRPTAEQRRAELVRRMLAGTSLDAFELAYDFDMFHVGAIARGPGAANALKDLAKALNCLSLVVPQDDETIWAWLGGRRQPDLDHLEHLVASLWPPQTPLAIGESAHGPIGWRHTHEQASAGFSLALRNPGRFFRYANGPLLASVIQDELLTSSIHELFLAPLEDQRDNGAKLRATLRAYFAAGHNRASAAKALKVSRQTVNNHLRLVEARLGRSLLTCATELDAALQLEAFERLPANGSPEAQTIGTSTYPAGS